MTAEDTAPQQPGLPAHLRDDLKWQPGQSGNPAGRPKGARSKLSESFLDVLLADFIKASETDATLGAVAIAAMRDKNPGEYARMIASLLAKELTGADGEPLIPTEIGWRRVNPDD